MAGEHLAHGLDHFFFRQLQARILANVRVGDADRMPELGFERPMHRIFL